jgi:hypothetical protein
MPKMTERIVFRLLNMHFGYLCYSAIWRIG